MEDAFTRFPEAEFEVTWHPFQLMQNSPTKSKLDVYLSFMQNEAQVRNYWNRLRSEGAQTKIDFEFDGQAGDTFDAHRLAEWALDKSGSQAQDKLVEAQFSEYMEKGAPPSDRASQLRCVERAGLDVSAAKAVLEGDAYTKETRAKIASAGRKGVTGVPAFFVNGANAGSGAMPADEWEQILRKVVAAPTADASAPGKRNLRTSLLTGLGGLFK